jgi:anti-sigma factor RsiW
MNVDELTPFDPAEEELVAYLDGELDAATRQKIEQRLATDAAFRDKLRRTQKVWDALDLLPSSHADQHFAASTIEMTVAQLTRESTSTQSRHSWRSRFPNMKLIAVALLAFFVGFRAVKTKQLSDLSREVRDVPVAERLEQLQDLQDLEFLELLKREQLFTGASHES